MYCSVTSEKNETMGMPLTGDSRIGDNLLKERTSSPQVKSIYRSLLRTP